MKSLTLTIFILTIFSIEAYAYNADLLACLQNVHALKKRDALKLVPLQKTAQIIMVTAAPAILIIGDQDVNYCALKPKDLNEGKAYYALKNSAMTDKGIGVELSVGKELSINGIDEGPYNKIKLLPNINEVECVSKLDDEIRKSFIAELTARLEITGKYCELLKMGNSDEKEYVLPSCKYVLKKCGNIPDLKLSDELKREINPEGNASAYVKDMEQTSPK